MALTKEQTKRKVAQVLKTGHWFLRRSDAGEAHNGFKWAPVGCWTTAPDWDPNDKCGGGLHGNGPATRPDQCFWSTGSRLEFCAYDARAAKKIGGNDGKIKARRAMILMVNSLPDGLTVGGYLNLSGTQITSLPDGLTVGGSLDLSGTQITSLPDGLTVGGKIIKEFMACAINS